jgi:hypothetical protein
MDLGRTPCAALRVVAGFDHVTSATLTEPAVKRPNLLLNPAVRDNRAIISCAVHRERRKQNFSRNCKGISWHQRPNDGADIIGETASGRAAVIYFPADLRFASSFS